MKVKAEIGEKLDNEPIGELLSKVMIKGESKKRKRQTAPMTRESLLKFFKNNGVPGGVCSKWSTSRMLEEWERMRSRTDQEEVVLPKNFVQK